MELANSNSNILSQSENWNIYYDIYELIHNPKSCSNQFIPLSDVVNMTKCLAERIKATHDNCDFHISNILKIAINECTLDSSSFNHLKKELTLTLNLNGDRATYIVNKNKDKQTIHAYEYSVKHNDTLLSIKDAANYMFNKLSIFDYFYQQPKTSFNSDYNVLVRISDEEVGLYAIDRRNKELKASNKFYIKYSIKKDAYETKYGGDETKALVHGHEDEVFKKAYIRKSTLPEWMQEILAKQKQEVEDQMKENNIQKIKKIFNIKK